MRKGMGRECSREVVKEVLVDFGGFWWILVDFMDEGVIVGRNRWGHWKVEEKLGGGAQQGKSDWSKITEVMDQEAKEAPELEVLCPPLWSHIVVSQQWPGNWEDFIYGGLQRFSGALRGIKEDKELQGQEVWGSFWSFHKGDLCALRRHNLSKKKKREAWEERMTAVGLHLKGQDTARISKGQEGVQFKRQQERLQEGKGAYQEDTKRGKKWLFERKTRPLCEHKGGMSGLEGTEAGPAGPAVPSGREATIRKVMKIPKEEELMYDGKGFRRFFDLFGMTAESKGAGDHNKVKQVVFFCKGKDLKEEAMEMDGWQELDWGNLVKEMKARWGRYRPATMYTIQELWTLVDVSSKGDYEEFSYYFNTRLKYLEREGTFRNEKEACTLLWRALSKKMQEIANVRLIKGKKMVENRSGGYSLPTLKGLKLAVDGEMKFKEEVSVEGSIYYRPFQAENEIMRDKLNKKRDRVKEGGAVDQLAKKLYQMTDILKSFIGQTVERSSRLEESLKKTGERREVYEARSIGSFVCYYCGMQGHSSTRCPRVEEDIKNGLVHFHRTRTFSCYGHVVLTLRLTSVVFATQVTELPLPPKEDSFVGCNSLVHPKEEEEDEGRIMEVDLGKRVRVQKKGAAEPGPSRKREKAAVAQGEEEVLQWISDEIGEEEEDYDESQRGQKERKEEAVVTMKLTPREQERILKARKRAATLLKERPRHLESQLGREHPGVIKRTLKTILDTGLTHRLGDLLLTSSGVVEGLQRQMTRKGAPSGVDSAQMTSIVVDSVADSDVEDPRFCTPLVSLDFTVRKYRTKALVSSGSMINVIPEEIARKWGLAMVGSDMKQRGVVGHLNSLLGVVEGCPVGFKGKMESTEVTFCVAKGVKHLILGRPFLMDLGARLKYGETGEVMSYVMGDGRWLKLPLHVPEESSKSQILTRKEEWVRHPIPNMDKGEEELRLLGKSKTCSWVGLEDSTPVSQLSGREEEDKSPVKKGMREEKKKWSEWEFPALKEAVEEEPKELLDKNINWAINGEELLRRAVEWVYGTQEETEKKGFQLRGWERKQEKTKPMSAWEFGKEEEGKGRRKKEKELELLDKSKNCSWVGEVTHSPCWKELGKEDSCQLGYAIQSALPA
ncbi:hypothetical protein PPACK8108_LOCUS21159 [Phakopsora pachyrhizi]|uniref:CCHC-type domain-containing protein n=1 Tax=Phakopsora pachyrhizi TaxID=170000 RepID=A0AAV0BH14_PHAPC|nr:hypothetical protein PPACK8108_LOCUS21159 [Phakopsora pachyrhizi]